MPTEFKEALPHALLNAYNAMYSGPMEKRFRVKLDKCCNVEDYVFSEVGSKLDRDISSSTNTTNVNSSLKNHDNSSILDFENSRDNSKITALSRALFIPIEPNSIQFQLNNDYTISKKEDEKKENRVIWKDKELTEMIENSEIATNLIETCRVSGIREQLRMQKALDIMAESAKYQLFVRQLLDNVNACFQRKTIDLSQFLVEVAKVKILSDSLMDKNTTDLLGYLRQQ